jgi:hypothetical protein
MTVGIVRAELVAGDALGLLTVGACRVPEQEVDESMASATAVAAQRRPRGVPDGATAWARIAPP